MTRYSKGTALMLLKVTRTRAIQLLAAEQVALGLLKTGKRKELVQMGRLELPRP